MLQTIVLKKLERSLKIIFKLDVTNFMSWLSIRVSALYIKKATIMTMRQKVVFSIVFLAMRDS